MTRTDAPAEELVARLRETPSALAAASALLDALDHAERVRAVRSLKRADQRRLYDAAAGFRPLDLADLVPAARADLATVRHFGVNSLPAFSHFEKRFCRPPGAEAAQPEALYGFNFQSLSPLTGPGYFLARRDPERPEILVDYREVPPQAPPGWPALRPNHRGLSRFVYGFMIDTLRGVSEHVSVGSAARHGKDLNSWFVLCRQD